MIHSQLVYVSHILLYNIKKECLIWDAFGVAMVIEGVTAIIIVITAAIMILAQRKKEDAIAKVIVMVAETLRVVGVTKIIVTMITIVD